MRLRAPRSRSAQRVVIKSARLRERARGVRATARDASACARYVYDDARTRCHV